MIEETVEETAIFDGQTMELSTSAGEDNPRANASKSPTLKQTRAYIYAISATVLALLIAWPTIALPMLASPTDRFHSFSIVFILLFPAIVFSALFCGIGPSVAATIVSLAGLRYWFLASAHSLPGEAFLISVVAFLFATSVIVAMGELHRRKNEALRSAHQELDEQVKERTAELNTANTSLRHLTACLLQLQDDGRRRFAPELHDSVGQTLAALSMNLSVVRSDIDRMKRTATTLNDSEALVQEMSKEIRTISHLLHPPLLDEAGLLSALRWFVEGFAQRSNIEVELDIAEDFGRLPRELETAVFRIVQECLTNVHRHSGSPTASIRVARSHAEIIVEIADSGKGIPKEKQEELATAGTPGVGISGMRERLRQLGGSLDITSNPSGTVVKVRLPVAAASIAAA
jgi:signal transduction histidine kinase